MKRVALFVLIIAAFSACNSELKEEPQFTSEHISQVTSQMSDLMINDVTNPPLAARFFSYACLAGYEVVSQNDSSFASMHGVLKEYPKIEKPVNI